MDFSDALQIYLESKNTDALHSWYGFAYSTAEYTVQHAVAIYAQTN